MHDKQYFYHKPSDSTVSVSHISAQCAVCSYKEILENWTSDGQRWQALKTIYSSFIGFHYLYHVLKKS